MLVTKKDVISPRRQARQGKKRQKGFLGVLGALGENT
jgi:hypothetical protein